MGLTKVKIFLFFIEAVIGGIISVPFGLNVENGGIFISGLMFGIVGVIVFNVFEKNKADKNKIEENKKIKTRKLKPIIQNISNKYESIFNSLDFPNNCDTVNTNLSILEYVVNDKELNLINDSEVLNNWETFCEFNDILDSYNFKYNETSNNLMFVWKSNGYICFLPTLSAVYIILNHLIDKPNLNSLIDNLNVKKIQITKIQYYYIEGEVIVETKISGGGGGGSSVGGAIVGAVLAGGVGAIVGSRKKNEPISSEMIKHDNRISILKYFDENEELKTIHMSFNAYDILEDLIPEKEYKYIKYNQDLKSINSLQEKSFNKNDTIKEKLIKLTDLKDNGLITEKEYSLKRKEIISDI